MTKTAVGRALEVTARNRRSERGSIGIGPVADRREDGEGNGLVVPPWRHPGESRGPPVAAGVANPWWSSSAAFADYDADGDLDLYVANYVDFAMDNNKMCGDLPRRIRTYCHSDAYEGVPDALYRNEGDGTFREVAAEAGLTRRHGKGLGVVWSDLDLDGDLDAAINNHDQRTRLLRNDGGNARHWLRLQLRGRGAGNRDAIGARATVAAGGRRQVDEVRSGTSCGSENERALHFGLGEAGSAEQIEIHWPSGAQLRVEAVAADQILVIVEP